MRIYRAVEDESNLPEEDKEKIAILRLVPNGEYITNVGMRQDEYFILEHTGMDNPEIASLLRAVSETNFMMRGGMPADRTKLIIAWVERMMGRCDEHP